MQAKRVLVTGANGRLARVVASALPPEVEVRAVDVRFSSPLPSRVETVEADLRDAERMADLVEGAGAVLHLAPLRALPGDELAQLDEATRGTYALVTAALDAGVPKIVVGSSLELFDRLPAEWDVSESWRPRPEPRIEHLRAWLAELSTRELVRTSNVTALCLRFGVVVDDAEVASLPYDPRWVHEEDAAAGVLRALAYGAPGWSVFHVTAAGRRAKVRAVASLQSAFGYEPRHDFRARWTPEAPTPADSTPPAAVLSPAAPIPSRPIRRVVVFGAGGPLAAAAARELAADYDLRLTDVRPIAEIAAEGPRPDQHPGAPVAAPLGAPHELRVADVTDLGQVMAACEGMDAVLNCSVIRTEPTRAFTVNTLGAYTIARAAAAHGIRRVVHTGPQQVTLHGDGDYSRDYDIPAEAPPRPGRHLYGHSKYLGQEILRVFADYYGLEAPVLLFDDFIQPAEEERERLHAWTTSWADAASAIRRALEATALPSPFEVLHVGAELPHGRYTFRRAREVLGWQPQDDLRRFWDGATRAE